MAARVNAVDVRVIFNTDLSDDALGVWITQAHLFVERRLAGFSLDEDLLKELERLVAAHFACAGDPRAERERRGDASVDYQTADGARDGLLATDFGKQAIALDPTGMLATVSDRPAGFNVIDPARCV